jgi:hypothetical protein
MQWERRIDGAIERARVAVLLLSHGFYASRFIRERATAKHARPR